MCGIAGLIGRIDERNRRAVAAMSGAMDHRGPDGDGRWTSEADADGWGCLLAHRRLAVLDLSTAADQPMVDDPSGVALVYNGELFNFAELRRDLDAAGAAFGSTGDTEVVLRLLARKGIDAPAVLRGMFALGAWDPASRTLLLARDALGIKPLYVCRNPDPGGDWSLAFSSELRPILASGLLAQPRLDPNAIASVVWNGFVMGPGTAVRDVELLPPATVATFDGRGRSLRQHRYWSVAGPAPGPRSSVEEVADELRRSVELHLASDVPLGLFLSSGVDSASVANLAGRVAGPGLTTFTLAFEEAAENEGGAAAEIAAAIGTDHREILLTGADFDAGLEQAMEAIDQPTFDALNSIVISRSVRDAGITVALVGTGGDELFGGYQTFRHLPRLLRSLRWLPSAGRLSMAEAVRRAGRQRLFPAQTRWAKIADLVERGDDLVALYQLSYALFLPGFQRQLLVPGIDPLPDGLPPSMGDELRSEIAGRPVLSALGRLEQRCFLGERLLRDSDAASMAASLELRLPLVDQRLTEAVDRLPESVRFEPVGRKDLLRQVGLDGLDPRLFERPKQGFVLPLDRWLRGPLRERVGDVLADAAACERVGLEPMTVRALWDAYQRGDRGLYWSRVWALYVLAAWSDRYKVAL